MSIKPIETSEYFGTYYVEVKTSDGVKTFDYWKSGIKKFADAIRTGYNDVNIPIVMVTNLMGNSAPMRIHISNALSAAFTLKSFFDSITLFAKEGRQNAAEWIWS